MPGTPPLRVAIPRGCESILRQVPAPVLRMDDEALLKLAETLRALGIANTRIDLGRKCIAAVRKRYAGKH